MNKEQFEKEISEIDVPEFEVLQAIDIGIKNGREIRDAKNKFSLKGIGTITSIAASAFLASGLIFAPVSNVLAAVPVIGSVYEKFGLQIGYQLLKSELITQTDQIASSNGVDITVTSAYYDGNVIGITFIAKGDRLSMDQSGDEGPESGYAFQLFDGNEQNQWASSMTQLEETEEGYVAAMEFYNPEAELPADFQLPLTFNSIAGVKGVWQFNIPLEQIPLETIGTSVESHLEDKGYSLQMESVVKGKATTLLNYQETLPLDGKRDQIRLNVFDDKGNRLAKNSANVLASGQDENGIQQEVRELFSSKIEEDATYLTVEAEVVKDEDDTIYSLDSPAPIVVSSNRFEYGLTVNSIKQNDNQLVLDYTIQNIDSDAVREDIFQNFADFIMLVRTGDVQSTEDGNSDMERMMENSVRSIQAKRMKGETLHYQSVFSIEDIHGFNFKDYSLTVPFGTLSANQPIKMPPIKIDLTEK